MNEHPEPKLTLRPPSMILLVTGVTVDAERHSRPLAYHIREHILAWQAVELDDDEDAAPGTRDLEAVVCSDVWWLNNPELRACPTISVGAPEENALSAHLASRLPSVYTIDRRLIVQMDLDGVDLQAACWGVDRASTTGAVDRFLEGYLDRFLESCCARLDLLAG